MNGAAGNFLCPAEKLSPNGFGTVMDIDAKGTWHCCAAAFKHWMGANGGCILNIERHAALWRNADAASCLCCQGGCRCADENLAVEWGPKGIRVNAIAPGPIGDTEGARRLFAGEVGQRLARQVPVGRLGAIEDIANLSVFLLSAAASNINGAILVSDGGLCLTGNFRMDPQSP